MSYEEEIAWGVQQMLDADLQFPQEVPDRNVVKTNADHIRSMTDEELAMDIMHLNFCPPNIDEYKECGANANCHQCWVDWLKQPFGGGDM